MHRLAAAVIAATVLAIATPTLAQVASLAPTSAVEVDLDPGPAGIPLGGSHGFPFGVTLRLDNILCNQAATATVALTLVDKPSPLNGVQATVPASLTFDVPQGNYASSVPALAAFDATQEATLAINVTEQALSNHDHAFNVTASFDGSLAGCQGAGAIPAAQDSAEHAIRTGPPLAAGAARGAQRSTTTGAAADGNEAPAPAIGLLAGAILLTALRRR